MENLALSTQQYFELLPGKQLDLQFTHPVGLRLKTSLVGYSVGQYIIIKHPEPSKLSSYQDVLVAGNMVIVRYIVEGSQGQCCAFKSTIRSVSKHPYIMIFIDFPASIENRELRNHQRYVTHLPAAIYASKEKGEGQARISGVINDVSAKGCGFSFKSNNSKLSVNKTDIVVVIALSEEASLHIPAKVCNSRYQQGKINVGIAFVDADQQVQQLLEHLLIESDR
ncbi:flagellar brake protein [Thalassotalea montiporae]